MKIKFTKMQAFGNDYVYIDAITQTIENPSELAIKVSNRNFGIGSDGMVLICPSTTCDFRMRIFNPDGTEAEMCGNALRSTSHFLYHYGFTSKTKFVIETYGGNQSVELFLENGKVVNVEAIIGKAVFEPEQIPVSTTRERFIEEECLVIDRKFKLSTISWGNPHTVLEYDNLSDLDIEKYGKYIEYMECFPKKTNVTFVERISDDYLKIREWERGTGETLGCGTGCCSAVVILNLLGKCGRNVLVEQIGGNLHVVIDDEGNVHMKGPTNLVFEGIFLNGEA